MPCRWEDTSRLECQIREKERGSYKIQAQVSPCDISLLRTILDGV